MDLHIYETTGGRIEYRRASTAFGRFWVSDVNQVDALRGEVDAACGPFFVSPTSLPWLERWCR
jgi:hypothetical protein